MLVFSVRFRALVVSSVRFRTIATAPARFFIGGFRRFAAFGQRIAGNFGLEQAFYFVERETIFLSDEGNGTSGASGASCSADAVHVVFGVTRCIVVDDHLNVVDVDAAAHDVGGNEDVNLALLEGQHHFVALALLKIGVHGRAVEAAALQNDVEFLDPLLGRDENNDALGFSFGEDVLENGRFVVIAADVDALIDFLGRFRDGDFDFHGLVHDFAGHLGDFGRHGGRE